MTAVPSAAGRASLPRLLVLTDRSQLRLGRGLVGTIRECVAAGLSHVVVREHDLAPTPRAALVGALADVPGLTVISSRIQDPCAHGLHQAAPRTDVPNPGSNAGLWSRNHPLKPSSTTITPRYSREVAREGARGGVREVLGRSCHSAEEVRRAGAEGVDYVTLSPFASTRSKPGYGPPLPESAYAGHPVPVYALGGVTVENAAAAREAGAHGVAVMGAVMRSADPAATVARLLEVTR